MSKKNGKKYTIFGGLLEDGSILNAVVDSEVAKDFDLPTMAMPSRDQVKQLFEELPVVEVEFGQRGQLVKVSAE